MCDVSAAFAGFKRPAELGPDAKTHRKAEKKTPEGDSAQAAQHVS